MAWAFPITWIVGSMTTHATLNVQIRDNMNNWSTHKHLGVVNAGSEIIANDIGLARVTFADWGSGSPQPNGMRIFATGTTMGIKVGATATHILSNSTHTHGGL